MTEYIKLEDAVERAYQLVHSEEVMEWLNSLPIITMGQSEELKHIFELSFALDNQSAGRDYVALRNTHYQNIEWLHNHGLMEEYYKYFTGELKKENK